MADQGIEKLQEALRRALDMALEDVAESRKATLGARRREREQLDADMESFLRGLKERMAAGERPDSLLFAIGLQQIRLLYHIACRLASRD